MDISYHRCRTHRINRDLAWTFGTNLAARVTGVICEQLPYSHWHLDGACTGQHDQCKVLCGEDGCTRPLEPHTVRGTTVPGISCESKCRTADGASCRCSCGGRQHGKERE